MSSLTPLVRKPCEPKRITRRRYGKIEERVDELLNRLRHVAAKTAAQPPLDFTPGASQQGGHIGDVSPVHLSSELRITVILTLTEQPEGVIVVEQVGESG